MTDRIRSRREQKAFTPRDYSTAFQIIAVVSCVLVLLLHVRVTYWSPEDEARWWFDNFISFFGMIAVPNFLMMSGSNLIDYLSRYDTKTFFKKRFVRLGIPYLLWTTISFLWALSQGDYVVKEFGDIFRPYYSNVVNGTYWYVRTTLALYLVVPIIAFTLRGVGENLNRRKRMIDYMILLSLTITFLIPLGRRYMPAFMETFQIPFGSGYIVYMLIGYRLTKFPVPRITKVAANVLGLIGSVFFLIGTAHISFEHGRLDTQFADYLTLPLLAMSVAFFINLTAIDWDRRLTKSLKSSFQYVSTLTFGIYMVQLPIIITLNRIMLDWGWEIERISMVIVRFLFSLAISVGLTVLLRKSSWARKYLVP